MMNAAYASSHNQGIAQRTQGRDKTANNLYNTWMMHYYIVLLFAEYAQLLIAHPVFHGWSNPGVGTWEEQENPDHLGVETVMKYYEPIFAQLKAKFPNHSFLKGDESHQQWWVNQKANLQKGLEQQKHHGDGDSFNPKCHALYLINEPGHLCAEQRDQLSKCDLKHICSSLNGKAKEMGTKHYEK